MVELTPKEFDILYLLASHPKKVFSMESIFKHVWREEYFEGSNTVMVHIRTLRKKFQSFTSNVIHTLFEVRLPVNNNIN